MNQFSPNSMRRISSAVRKIERLPTPLPRGGMPSPRDSDSDYWIEITGSSGTAHSWKLLIPDGTGGFEDHPSGATGTDTAFEANGREGTPIGTVCRAYSSMVDDEGNLIVLFEKDQGDQNPGSEGQPLELNYEHGEHDNEPSGEEWDRANQDATTDASRGVVLTVQTGTLYNHESEDSEGPVLLAFLRDLTFDADGHLVLIGPETRVVIDDPRDCDGDTG